MPTDPTTQNQPVAAHHAAQEPPAAPGTGTDTPEAAESESGRLHAVPRAERKALHTAYRAAHAKAAQLLQVSDDRIILAAIKAYQAARQDTPEAHSGAELILGRALIVRKGVYDSPFLHNEKHGYWTRLPGSRFTRSEIDHAYPEAREVLLVPGGAPYPELLAVYRDAEALLAGRNAGHPGLLAADLRRMRGELDRAIRALADMREEGHANG